MPRHPTVADGTGRGYDFWLGVQQAISTKDCSEVRVHQESKFSSPRGEMAVQPRRSVRRRRWRDVLFSARPSESSAGCLDGSLPPRLSEQK